MIKNFEKIENSLAQLRKFCEECDFKGYDPYDGLNSKLFRLLKFNRFRVFRLLWIQLFKLMPINLRPIVGVGRGENPKGLALFLTGYCNLYWARSDDSLKDTIHTLADRLIKCQSLNYSGACWGYNFPWQSRAFFLEAYTPTVVATSYAANALIDAYEVTKSERYLELAKTSVKFITEDLNRTVNDDGIIFSYSPFDNTRVYNASLLASKILARVYSYTKEPELRILAEKSVRAVVRNQSDDGSWIYGEMSIQSWVDSFHTGFNLECISDYSRYCCDTQFDFQLKKGMGYYIDKFFLADGTPKYYNDSVYPVDIHSPAQLLPTLYKTNASDEMYRFCEKVLLWVIDNMQNKKYGFFYYRKTRFYKNKIPYMRWSQAWIFYALTYIYLWKADIER